MKLLTEKEAEDFLEKEGFKVAKRIFIKNKENVKEIKNLNLKFPLVAKISSHHIIHKAKIGGTILNIKNIKEAEFSFDKLKEINNFEGVLFQEFIEGKELILGLKNTPEFGLVIMFGKGGSELEKEKDVSFRVPPIKSEDAEQMLEEIKFYKQIKEQINKNKAIESILNLSKLAEKYKNIKELDINPMIINNKDAVVVDARIVFE